MRIALAVSAFLLVACKPAGGPIVDAEAGVAILEAGAPIVTGACSLLEGVDSSGTVASICATVEEVAQVVAFILTLRSANVTPPACMTLPGSTMCASKAEIAKGIHYLVIKRRAAFILQDASAP